MEEIHSISKYDEKQKISFVYPDVGKFIIIKILRGFACIEANVIISDRYRRKVEAVLSEDNGVNMWYILASSITVSRISDKDLKFTLEVVEREDVNADNPSTK